MPLTLGFCTIFKLIIHKGKAMQLRQWMKQILINLAFRFPPKKNFYRIAVTPEEKDKIFRFRYDIYQEELGLGIPGTFDDLKIIKDPADDAENCVHFYLERNNEIIAAARIIIYQPNEIREEMLKFYDLQEQYWIKQYVVCEFERFITHKDFRSKFISLKFLSGIIQYIIQHDVKVMLQCAKPFLVPHFYAIGCRPYTKKLIDYAGIEIPLIGLIDKSYTRKIKSPARFLIPKGKVFSSEVLEFFYHAPSAITFDKAVILKELGISTLVRSKKSPLDFFKQLINHDCFLLYIDQPIKLITEGMADKTIFYFISGGGWVEMGKQPFHVIANQFVGEFSIFMPQGRRSAEVYIEKGSKLLVIKESAILKFKRSYPKKYNAFLELVIRDLIFKNIGHMVYKSERDTDNNHPQE